MLRLWSKESGQPLGEPVHVGDCPLLAVAWSRDGRRLVVSTGDGQALLLDGNGLLLEKRKLGGAGAGRALALSADGRWLAAAGSDRLLQLLDTTRFQDAPVPLAGVLEDLSSLAFSGDGRFLVTGSTGGNIRIWETLHQRGNGNPGEGSAPQPLSKPLAAHPGSVLAIDFSEDGTRFFSVGREGAVRPWPAPSQWAPLMCDKLGANLSRRMWNEWVSPDIPYRCVCPDLPVEPDDPAGTSKKDCPAG
jgi:WD40 repeat protein